MKHFKFELISQIQFSNSKAHFALNFSVYGKTLRSQTFMGYSKHLRWLVPLVKNAHILL